MTEIGRALRAARTAAGISLQGMAARTNYSKPYLGQLETGVRVVRKEHVAAYEAALGTWLGPLHEQMPVATADAMHDGDLPAELAPLLLPAAGLADGDNTGFTPTEMDAAEKLAIWARARQWHDSTPPIRIVTGWLEANLSRLQGLSPGSPRARRALRVGAELADIAAAMYWDAEDNDSARRFYVRAARLAYTAGDSRLVSAILVGLTWQCLDRGRPQDGLEVAQLAQYVARRSATSRLRATLADLEACAYGILGDQSAFQRTLAYAAECRLEAADSDETVSAADRSLTAAKMGSIIGPRRHWPGPGRQSLVLGANYRLLARTRPQLARAAFGADRIEVPDDIVDPAIALTSAARLQLMLGEPDRAADLVHTALPLCGPAAVGRVAARLRDFHHESSEFDEVSEIHAVRTAIDDVTADR
ncbi:helix-turn-helix domain-containing protein [Nocardia abscessus]|uniref:helix-turn-helix domain-containing protein n=1 Tax=Nocardia abscessus TaxID=120957 RepID=UPI0002F55824|nr:helix-turn-helix transcriptional regulator [Nocardia abscessus]MCC3331522.1 helix-turn-helix transcriptional regulator [Nocardia abscessus]